MLSLFFMLVFVCLIGCFAFGIAGVALKKRKWVLCCLACAVSLFFLIILVLVSFPDSLYVRSVRDISQIEGVYRLSGGADRELLTDMGYADFSGEMILCSDGSFIGNRIPASCVHGLDENVVEFTGGYYNLSGYWVFEMDEYGLCRVKVDLNSTQLLDIPVKSDKSLAISRNPLGPIYIYLLKGCPFRLAFVYVDSGGEDYFISYSKI